MAKKDSLLEKIKKSFSPQEPISKKAYITLAVISFAAIIATWLILTETGKVNELFLPAPVKTIKAAIQLFLSQGYINDIGMSTFRVMTGFFISVAIAVPVGILVGVYGPFEAVVEPVMSFIRYLPASAFIPLFILWIGIDEPEKIAVIIIGSLPQLILMIAVCTRNVSHDLIEVSYTLGTKKSQVLYKIILPSSLPSILDALRMVLGWAWTYVIVAEMVGASSGIGHMTIQSQRMLNVANIFVGILTIGFLGLLFDYIFKWLDKLLFKWK